MINRLRRLGAPLAVFGLVLSLTFKFVLHATGPAGSVLYFGHLWYLEHLLLLSLVYALLRVLRKCPVPTGLEQTRIPGPFAILSLALAVSVVSGTVRIWYPIDRWINLLGFVQVAPSDVPRDLTFFIIGVLAYRRQWFQRFPARAGMAWLTVGVAAAALWYGYDLGLHRVLPLTETAMDIFYLVWESLLCFGLCIGLLVLFREKLCSQRPLGRKMAEAQYAAYVYHLPIVLLLQFLAHGLDLSPLAKFGLVTVTGIPFTFAVSYLMRRPLR
jgi:surface polysaccharide O-acyltransferase-like enzyme